MRRDGRCVRFSDTGIVENVRCVGGPLDGQEVDVCHYLVKRGQRFTVGHGRGSLVVYAPSGKRTEGGVAIYRRAE